MCQKVREVQSAKGVQKREKSLLLWGLEKNIKENFLEEVIFKLEH